MCTYHEAGIRWPTRAALNLNPGLRFYVPRLLHLVRAHSTGPGPSTRFGGLVCVCDQILLGAIEDHRIQILLEVVYHVVGRLKADVILASKQSSASLRVDAL
eukprot:scaffold87654_cov69-Phaeocystis_antarctica.AAC.5